MHPAQFTEHEQSSSEVQKNVTYVIYSDKAGRQILLKVILIDA